jgi:hypothetical protein
MILGNPVFQGSVAKEFFLDQVGAAHESAQQILK